MSTKQIIDKAKRELERLTNQVSGFLLDNQERKPGDLFAAGTDCLEWENLYYSHPYSNQVKGYAKKAEALIAVRPQLAEGLRPLVAAVVAKGEEIEALKVQIKSEPKAKRQQSSNGGGYSFSTQSLAIVDHLKVQVGEYLLLHYGAGTQLVFVVGASQKRLAIKRLGYRGTRLAQWFTNVTKINRQDPRIIGYGIKSPGDPTPSF